MRNASSIQFTRLQYICLIHGTQVGVGFLTLPRELAQEAGTDGWISIIIGWLASVIASLFIVRTMKKNPDTTLFDVLTIYFGKWIGKTATVFLLLYFVTISIVVLFNIISILRIWLMPNTPNFMLVALLMVPTYMIIHHGMTMIGRYAELIFYFSLWIIVLLIFPLRHSHWLYLLPVIKEGWFPILHASRLTVLSFLGFEISFILYPFLMKKSKAVSGIVIANTLTMVFYLITTLVCFSYFNSDEIVQYTWPTLSLLKVIRVQFMDRWDVIFLSIYMIVISVTWIVYMSLTVFSVNHLTSKSHSRTTSILIICIVGALSFILTLSQTQIRLMSKYISQIGFGFAFLFPILLWLYVKIYEIITQRRDIH